PLSKIRIDDTQNRPVNWQHLLGIIANFDPTIVQGISCYEDPEAPGCYIAYDGQHTSLAIYAVYCMLLDMLPEQIIVPAVVTRTDKKSEIRNVFIKINSPKHKKEDQGVKLSLSPYNLFQQMVYGVRIDGSENPFWKAAEMKQRMLEDAHLYMKDENEFHVPIDNGCITSPNDIINAGIHSVHKFCEYWKERRKIKDELVHIKELTIILALMDRFKDIELSQKDYELMANVFYNSFAFNYRPQSKLYANVDNAFNCWFKLKYHPNCDWEDLDDDDIYDLRQKGAPIYPKPLTNNSPNQTTHTVTYLCALLTKKGFTKVPRSDDIFVPDMEDVI
ncbi:hypothetical protein EBU71_18880, partial [bacterium]|nr:hypothetical protein [Candidatus Elulimicrobium humile]